MSLIHNERTKLLATAANNAAVGCFVAGVVAPSFILLTAERPAVATLVLAQVFWISVSAMLHWLGRRVLAELKE